MAGSPCPVELMKRVVDVMGAREVTIAYGMTETSPVSFQSHGDDSQERRVTTVGRVHPHTEVKIIDPETGATVPVGAVGELCTRGYSVMLGYWDDAANTAASIDADGFMHTGDLATIDAEGYGNIVGRIKDMVIRGGENVYPREIEEFLYRHPAVQYRAGVRRSRCALRRRALRVDRPAAGHVGDRRRHPRLLPGSDRPLQDPALCRVRGRDPDDGDGQGAEIPHAGRDDRAAGAYSQQDGVGTQTGL